MNQKAAAEAIAAHALKPGYTLYFISALPPSDSTIITLLEKKLVKGASSIQAPLPPHQTISVRDAAIQYAAENCKTEWFVVYDESAKLTDARLLIRELDNRAAAWLRNGGLLIAKTLPTKRALEQCPVNVIPQYLRERGYAVTDDLSEPEHRIAVLTLMGSAARVEPWFLYMQRSDIPNAAKIVIADNSGDIECARLIASAAANLRGQFRSIEIINLGAPYQRAPDEAYIHPGKHIHVAEKYNEVLPALLPQCDFILFLEHDVIPPLNGFAKLMELIQEKGAAASAGAYEQPEAPHFACAAKGKERWTGIVELAKMPTGPFEVGMVGGGFTLYRSEVLQKCIPFTPTFWRDPVYLLGWDGTLGRDIAKLGSSIWLHPGVRCKHEFKSVSGK